MFVMPGVAEYNFFKTGNRDMNRYFFSRRKGEYHIIDRTLDTRIAKTDWREAAVQIVNALNSTTISLADPIVDQIQRFDSAGQRLAP